MASWGTCHLLSLGVPFLLAWRIPPICVSQYGLKKKKKITVLDTLRQSEGRLLTQKTALTWGRGRTMTRHDMACTPYADEDSRCVTTTKTRMLRRPVRSGMRPQSQQRTTLNRSFDLSTYMFR